MCSLRVFLSAELRAIVAFSLAIILTACGGGGGGSDGGGSNSDSDTTAPTAIVSPTDGATNIEKNITLTASFNEDMIASTIEATSFSLSDGSSSIAGTTSFDASTNIASFTPSSNLRVLQTYTANLKSSITDLSGNALAALDWDFTTRDGLWHSATLIENDNTGSAFGPKIAFDVSGNALAVWQQADSTRDNIWANRYTVGTGWGVAVLIETDDTRSALIPQIAIDDNGNAIAVWFQSDGIRDNIWANHYTADIGWDTAEMIETDNTGSATSPQIAFDSNGNALAVWNQYDGTKVSAWANRYITGTGWGNAELIETNNIGNVIAPQIAVDTDGNAMAVWMQYDSTRTNIWANRYTADTGWGTATLIETDNSGNANKPQITIDTNGNAMAVWFQSDGTRDNIWANRYTVGTGWDTATLIETDNSGNANNPQITIDTNGNAMAVWSQSDGIRDNIWVNRYTAGTGWGTTTLIETDNSGNANNPQIAIDNNGNALAVWSQSDGSQSNIWANRYTSDVGWGTVALIEMDNSGSAINPRIAIDANGNALAVWSQRDGTRYNIVANRFD